MIEFIKSLQEIKKLQQKWEETEISHRKSLLQVYFDRVLEKIEALQANFDLRFDIKAAGKLIHKVLSTAAPFESRTATGIITIVVDRNAPHLTICHQICSGLLAGNAVYIYFAEGFSDEIQFIYKSVLPEFPLCFFTGDAQLLEVMLTHPSVHGISYYGGHTLGESVANIAATSKKKLQISIGYHNAALVLADADLNQAADVIAQAFFVGKGHWPVNISEVFVLESKLTEFIQIFREKLLDLIKRSGDFSQDQQAKKFKIQILAEKGRLVLGGQESEPLIVEDFNHCSPLHQESIESTVLFIQPVKYAHEMVKWVKAFDHGGLALVFGPDEKVIKFGSQLGVSKVIANGWIEKMKSLPLGSRKTFLGINDSTPFGAFYSDVTSFDGLSESK